MSAEVERHNRIREAADLVRTKACELIYWVHSVEEDFNPEVGLAAAEYNATEISSILRRILEEK